jgi:hypothetical protein
MTCSSNFGPGPCSNQNKCPDKFGCPPNVCPDFTIRRHDTKPPLKVAVNDCDGPMDLTGLVLEVSMWAKAKIKKNLCEEDTYFALADGIGFEQIMIGDVILVDRVRMPERMLVVGFDEGDGLVLVQRGYQGTTPGFHKRGTPVRIFRVMNAPAQTEMLIEDIEQVDGTVKKDQITSSYLVYEWKAGDTCLPGCYWLEFKLLKMIDPSEAVATSSITSAAALDGTTLNSADVITVDATPSLMSFQPLPSVAPFESISCVPPSAISFTDISLTPASFGCDPGSGVEWVRRFPVEGEGFLVKIIDSPTAEL